MDPSALSPAPLSTPAPRVSRVNRLATPPETSEKYRRVLKNPNCPLDDDDDDDEVESSTLPFTVDQTTADTAVVDKDDDNADSVDKKQRSKKKSKCIMRRFCRLFFTKKNKKNKKNSRKDAAIDKSQVDHVAVDVDKEEDFDAETPRARAFSTQSVMTNVQPEIIFEDFDADDAVDDKKQQLGQDDELVNDVGVLINNMAVFINEDYLKLEEADEEEEDDKRNQLETLFNKPKPVTNEYNSDISFGNLSLSSKSLSDKTVDLSHNLSLESTFDALNDAFIQSNDSSSLDKKSSLKALSGTFDVSGAETAPSDKDQLSSKNLSSKSSSDKDSTLPSAILHEKNNEDGDESLGGWSSSGVDKRSIRSDEQVQRNCTPIPLSVDKNEENDSYQSTQENLDDGSEKANLLVIKDVVSNLLDKINIEERTNSVTAMVVKGTFKCLEKVDVQEELEDSNIDVTHHSQMTLQPQSTALEKSLAVLRRASVDQQNLLESTLLEALNPQINLDQLQRHYLERHYQQSHLQPFISDEMKQKLISALDNVFNEVPPTIIAPATSSSREDSQETGPEVLLEQHEHSCDHVKYCFPVEQIFFDEDGDDGEFAD